MVEGVKQRGFVLLNNFVNWEEQYRNKNELYIIIHLFSFMLK